MIVGYLVMMVACFAVFMYLEIRESRIEGRVSNHQDVMQLVMAALFWPVSILYVIGMYVIEYSMKNS